MFSKRAATIAIIIVLIILSILILSLNSRRPLANHGADRVAIALVSPFQKMIVATKQFLGAIWQDYFFLVNVADKLRDLHQELQTARATTYHYRELVLENQRLLNLLAMGQEIRSPWTAAQVVGKDPSPWFHTILVDKGFEEGVEAGQPVVSLAGIVGLVVQTTAHSAKVMLITDPNSAVDALVQSNRARGIVKGGLSGFCDLDYMLHKYEIKVGDTVVSSGMDGIFPKGLPIGKVVNIANQESGIFQSIAVSPFVDFNSLEEVLIVPATRPLNPS